jgi:hypothetical protein
LATAGAPTQPEREREERDTETEIERERWREEASKRETRGRKAKHKRMLSHTCVSERGPERKGGILATKTGGQIEAEKTASLVTG